MAGGKRQLRNEIVLSGEQKYRQSLKGIEGGLKDVAAKQALLNATFGAGDKSLAKHVQQQELLRHKLDAQRQKLAVIEQEQQRVAQAQEDGARSVQQLAQQHEQASAALDKARDRLASLRVEYESASASEGENTEETQRLRQEYDEAAAAVASAEKQLDKITAQHNSTAVAVEKNAQKTQQLSRDYDYAKAACAKTEGELKTLNATITKSTSVTEALKAKLKDMGGHLDKVGQKISSFGQQLTRVATVPIAGAMTLAGKSYMDFGDKMADVATIADTTEMSIEEMSDAMLDASDNVGMAATSMAEASYQAISSGIGTADAVGYVEEAAKAAKVGLTDVTTVVDGSTSAMNAWGISASEATSVFDKMIVAQNLGKTTLGQIASQIGNLTGIAPQLNMTLDETLAATAALTKNGVQTGQAMNGLKAVMAGVLKPTKEAQDEAKRLGIAFDAAALKSMGFTGFLAQIQEKSGGSEESLAKLFGSVEGLSQVMLLGGAAAKDYDAALSAMKDSAGVLDEAYDVKAASPLEKMRKSLNQLKNEAIRFGQAMAPMIDLVSGALGGLADKLNGLDEGQRKWVLQMAMGTMAIGPLINGVGKLTSSIGSIKSALSGTSFLSGAGGGKLALAAAGVAAVVAGVVALKNHLDSLSGSNQIKAALGKVTLDTGAIDTALQEAGTVTHELEVLTAAKIKLEGDSININDYVEKWLSDGKIETKEQKEDFKKRVEDMLQPIYDGVTEAFDEKKKALDEAFATGIISKGEYEDRLAELTETTNATKTAMNAEKDAYVSYVMTLCEQGRKPTEAELQKLEELRQKIVETGQSILDAQSQALQASRASYNLVKSGGGTGRDIVAGVSYLQSQREIDTSALDNLHQQTMADLQAKLDKAQAEGKTQLVQKIETDMQIESTNYETKKRKIEAEYTKQLSEMMDGLAKKYPEQAAKLKEIMGKQNMVEDITKALAEVSSAEGAEAKEAAVQALDELWKSMFPDEATLNSTLSFASKLEELKLDIADSVKNTDFSDIFTDFSTGIEAGALDGLDVSKVGETLSSLITAYDLTDDGRTVGEQLALGEAEGIAGGQGSVNAAVLAAVAATNSTLMSAQGIHSPSTVWASYGGYMMQGMAAGIQASRGRVVAAVGILTSGLRVLGRDSIRGLISGAESQRTALVNKYRVLAAAALAAARKALDSHSPSRKFMALGRDTAEGMLLGLQQRTASVRQAMQIMVSPDGLVPDAQHAGAAPAPASRATSITVQYTGAVSRRDSRKLAGQLGRYLSSDMAGKGI